MVRFGLHDDPSPRLSGGVGDHQEGEKGVVVEVQLADSTDYTLIALPDAEGGDIFGYGYAVVLLAEKPSAPRRRCLHDGSTLVSQRVWPAI